ncbi:MULTISPECIES: branched-chain amino acid ABC transporter permease [unclassified Rhizobium]|uniref:branched-chain amino acid ABC transporter permease n=1 Tax=unclassified Rhizobium TaxID=2613769 RepID=UPI00177CC965|nr:MULTISPECIES: branched-chain amino acid ABC transporter permease [unclassified Rhizobium]MBD8688542.1 branched-chain amino acid ABC transporter permease [Rhizobium sp. CFBP 13644]MBD8692956.1 branched-chain amino acid ABC transporter permease [Rhizobium sp. CFBP 13717]
MDFDTASILAVDGLSSGAVYILIAIGTVLIFTVTRVVFIPFGDIAAFSALTLAALESNRQPGTIGLVAILACLAFALELTSLARTKRLHQLWRAALFYLVLPLSLMGLVWLSAPLYQSSMALRIVFTLILIVPIAPLLDRIVYRPIADGSVLLLLIVSMALHFALVGIGLLFFGAEGVRTQPLTEEIFFVGNVVVTGQAILIMMAAVVFSLLLYLFFEFTLVGKSLRATAINRTGARLMGIRPERSGAIAYIVGSLMAGVSGILIAPVNTIFYDSGFLLGLRAFVGAIIGGMVSYPGTLVGSLFVGILESFSSFYDSSFRDVIVFSLLIPILVFRSFKTAHSEEHDEE